MKRVKSKELVLRAMTLAVLLAPVYGVQAADLETDTIVVTASKTAETIKAAPQAVEVVTAEDMKRMGATDLVSALQLADNVSLAESAMTGNQVMLRGMDTKHTLILVDGKRIAGEDTDSTANVYTLGRMSLDTVERVEIVRGATSSLYGSDAMGGVINIITKKKRQNYVKTSFGNFNQEEHSISLQEGKLGVGYQYSKWGTRENIASDSNKWRGPENDNVSLHYQFNDNLSLSYNRVDSQYHYITNTVDTKQEVERNNAQLIYSEKHMKATLYYVDRTRKKDAFTLKTGNMSTPD